MGCQCYLCVTLSNVGAYERTPRHDPPLERVDHTLVQVLTFPDRCSSNQPGSYRLESFEVINQLLEIPGEDIFPSRFFS